MLAKVVRELPSDPKPWLWTGQCEVEREDFAAARGPLETARSLDPDDGEVRLLLAIVLYQEEEFARASEELETAARLLGEERAEIDLYRGLLLLTRSDAASARDAAAWLEHARVLDARSVEPMASYYAGLGWTSAADDARARQALERVVREWPDTDWAEQAKRQLAALDARRQRIFGSLRAGLEYDSNAVLQGQGTPLPDEISSQRDIRGVWQGQVSGELLRRGDWTLAGALSYAGTEYRDLDSFDSHFPGATLWLDRRIGDATTLRLVADTGYAFVDGDSFLWTYRAALSAIQQWGPAGTTEASVRFWRDDYFVQSDDVPGPPCSPTSICGPSGIDERTARNRDGNGFSLGLNHAATLPVDWPFGEITVRGGYLFEHFGARGSEYSSNAHALLGGLRAALPWSFALDVLGGFRWRPYRHPTTFPDPPIYDGVQYQLSDHDRHETTAQVDVALERPITRWLTGSVAWRYERNHSNSAPFDYSRQIVGAYLTATFGH